LRRRACSAADQASAGVAERPIARQAAGVDETDRAVS
jgi:hypothetical protein